MNTLFTSQSRKAWVAALTSALLTPVLNLAGGADVLTTRSLVVAVISGILGAVAVWATDNADPELASAPEAAVTAPATGPQAATPLELDETDEFNGQTVPGE